jgi:Pirin-related protein
MIEIRKSEERGKTQLGWLKSYHSFSFGRYYDPKHVHFGPLRVLNDDVVMPGTGFGMHDHDNMEIVTYVIKGTLEHRDSMGTKGSIGEEDVQRMTAGTGVSHSEQNASKENPVHFFQIWFIPSQQGLAPSYEQKKFSHAQRRNVFLPVASRQKELGGVAINQDVTMWVASLDAVTEKHVSIQNTRGAYVHIVEGEVRINGTTLTSGDAAAIREESRFSITAVENSEVIFFDVPLVGWD